MKHYLARFDVDGPFMETVIPTVIEAEDLDDALEIGDALADHWEEDCGLGSCVLHGVREMTEDPEIEPDECWRREDLTEHFEEE